MDEFANAEVFGIVDSDETPRDTHFDAWHRPRKHWIRSKQWWKALDGLRKDRNHQDSSCFNMLSLPGGELLDVRYFYSMIESDDDQSTNVKKLRLTGFVNNPSDHERAQRNLPLIGIASSAAGDSVIKHDDIDNLSKGGVLKKTFENMGPFEVINLDYCNSIAPAGKRDRVDSVYQIINYQCQHQSKPWLFMFTTRTSQGSVSHDFFHNAHGLINDILSGSSEYSSRFLECYEDCLEKEDMFGENIHLKKPSDCEGHFSELFVVGFLTWVLSNARIHGVKVKLESAVRYDVEGDEAENDMFSIVLKFEKLGKVQEDPTGIANVQADDFGLEPQGVLASRVIPKVKRTKTVESILFSNPERYREVAQDLASLLEECGKCMTTFWDEFCRSEIEAQGWSVGQIRE